jgi:hypothetical protein
MESALVSAIALLALAVWRFVFAGLQRRAWFGGIAAARDNTLDQRPPILEQLCVGVIAENGWNPGSDRINPIEAESRAETYLSHIVALVGAAKKGNSYVLDVGTTRFRFRVRDRYVRRQRDASNPKCAYEETCFYSGFQGMPKAEQIAAALLQLRNNPALFDRWALQRDLAFKADGQVFARVR